MEEAVWIAMVATQRKSTVPTSPRVATSNALFLKKSPQKTMAAAQNGSKTVPNTASYLPYPSGAKRLSYIPLGKGTSESTKRGGYVS